MKDDILRPQPGPQTAFLESTADIAIYGGAAGGGKTMALLMEPLYHAHNPEFGCLIFRREATQLTAQGGLWDASMRIYPRFQAKPVQAPKPKWIFPSGAKISFDHLNHEKDVLNWQGTEICLLCFDELSHFSKTQVFYMFSRNRSTCGVKPYVRATTNPDADSWVAEFISWWIDPITGFPIKERSGVKRWFITRGDEQVFADTKEELEARDDCDKDEPKSLTFIAATIHDNKVLMEKDGGYISWLKSLNSVERARLLDGNWKIRYDGHPIDVTKFKKVEVIPPLEYKEIFADTAQKTKEHNDYSVFQCWGKIRGGGMILLDQIRGKWDATDLKNNVIAFWEKHKKVLYRENLRWLNIEDKVSGTSLIQQIRREGNIPVREIEPLKDKITRFHDAQPHIASEMVYLNVSKNWSTEWILDFEAECKAFRLDMTHKHDDQVDTMVYAILGLSSGKDRSAYLDWMAS